jgi:hypothetical protein
VRRAPLLLIAVLLLAACGSSTAAPEKPSFQAKPASRFKGIAVPATTRRRSHYTTLPETASHSRHGAAAGP